MLPSICLLDLGGHLDQIQFGKLWAKYKIDRFVCRYRRNFYNLLLNFQ